MNDSSAASKPAWWIYQGSGRPNPDAEVISRLPPPPAWRTFHGGPALPPQDYEDTEARRRLGESEAIRAQGVSTDEINMVNAALYLRRPLLLTGRPGTGKSSLAYKIARELRLGPVLRWPISSHTTLVNGLWEYDAIGRVQASAAGRHRSEEEGPAGEPDIGQFVHLGPLGTALLPHDRPRVLLIDELDKSDIDLPNDLLGVFEEGEFTVRPLVRIASRQPEAYVYTADAKDTVPVRFGQVRCRAFPIIVVTSNGEREFPPAFLRRCLRLEMGAPSIEQLAGMVAAHFHGIEVPHGTELIRSFVRRSDQDGGLATDQLLNAIYLSTSGAYSPDENWDILQDALWRQLGAL